MARTLFLRMVLRKFSEITNNKPIFSQYNILYNYEYFFFQSAFWSLFNHRQRSQSNQEQCSLCCGSPCFRVLLCTHYGPLQCFSTDFRKLKEIGVLRSVLPDYLISYVYAVINSKLLKMIILIASCFNGFLLNSNKPIKSSQLEKLANKSIFSDAFMIGVVNINSLHKSKNNFRLVKRKSSNWKNMDGEKDEF